MSGIQIVVNVTDYTQGVVVAAKEVKKLVGALHKLADVADNKEEVHKAVTALYEKFGLYIEKTTVSMLEAIYGLLFDVAEDAPMLTGRVVGSWDWRLNGDNEAADLGFKPGNDIEFVPRKPQAYHWYPEAGTDIPKLLGMHTTPGPGGLGRTGSAAENDFWQMLVAEMGGTDQLRTLTGPVLVALRSIHRITLRNDVFYVLHPNDLPYGQYVALSVAELKNRLQSLTMKKIK